MHRTQESSLSGSPGSVAPRSDPCLGPRGPAMELNGGTWLSNSGWLAGDLVTAEPAPSPVEGGQSPASLAAQRGRQQGSVPAPRLALPAVSGLVCAASVRPKGVMQIKAASNENPAARS